MSAAGLANLLAVCTKQPAHLWRPRFMARCHGCSWSSVQTAGERRLLAVAQCSFCRQPSNVTCNLAWPTSAASAVFGDVGQVVFKEARCDTVNHCASRSHKPTSEGVARRKHVTLQTQSPTIKSGMSLHTVHTHSLLMHDSMRAVNSMHAFRLTEEQKSCVILLLK